MDEMQKELLTEGHDVEFLAINVASGVTSQASLVGVCDFPLFQDTAEALAWTMQGGNKDDIYIYDAAGELLKYLPMGGDVDTNLSGAAGYANLKDAILTALGN